MERSFDENYPWCSSDSSLITGIKQTVIENESPVGCNFGHSSENVKPCKKIKYDLIEQPEKVINIIHESENFVEVECKPEDDVITVKEETIGDYITEASERSEINSDSTTLKNIAPDEDETPMNMSEKSQLKILPFVNYDCKCRNECSSLNEEERSALHKTFSGLKNWNDQSSYLMNLVSVVSVKCHRHTPIENRKSCSIIYNLNGKVVCKNVFTNTLGVSKHRTTYLVNRKFNIGKSLLDERGKNNPINKTYEATHDLIKSFLLKLPKYVNNSRSKKPILCLDPYLNITILHKMFKESNCDESSKIIKSRKYFSNVMQELGISFHPLKKEQCYKCLEFESKLKSDISDPVRFKVTDHLECHLKLSKSAVEASHPYNEESNQILNSERSSATDKTLAFSFDFQRSYPIPLLREKDDYLKKKLWLHSVGISNLKTNSGSVYLWTEADAKRGSNEVASALLTFMKSVNLNEFNGIHSFSSCCDGYNVHRNIVSTMIHFTNTTGIDEWVHTFLESGHQLALKCTDFDVINRRVNGNVKIYNFDDWVDLVGKCRFTTFNMRDKIVNVGALSELYTFRDTNTNGELFDLNKVRRLRFKPGSKIVGYKYSNIDSDQYKMIELSRHMKDDEGEKVTLDLAYPDGRKISKTKMDDIMSLMNYIPPIKWDFFNSLQSDEQISEEEFDTHPCCKMFDDA